MIKLKILDKSIHIEILLVTTLTILGAIIRFSYLGYWSLWNDEVHTIQVALKSILTDEAGNSIYYPINFLITRLSLNIFGVNEFSARLFPAIIGTLTIPLIYVLGKYLFNRQVALLASILLSIHTWHIDWSQNARYYTLETFLLVISSYYFFKGYEKNNKYFIILTLFFLLLATLSHPSATFMISAYISYLFFILLFKFEIPVNYKFNMIVFISPFIVILFAIAPWYKNLVLHLLQERFIVSSPIYIIKNILYHVTIPMATTSLAAGLYLIIKKDRRGLYLVSCIMMPSLLLLIASKFTLAYGAYVFYTLPLYCLLSAYACDQLFNYLRGRIRILGYGFILTLILVLLSNNYLYFKYENGNRSKWKEACEYVKKEIKKEDIVFASEGDTVRYYLNNNEKVYWLNRFKLDNINYNSVWLLLHSYDENQMDGDLLEFVKNKSRLVKEFHVNTSVKRRDIKIYLYNMEKIN